MQVAVCDAPRIALHRVPAVSWPHFFLIPLHILALGELVRVIEGILPALIEVPFLVWFFHLLNALHLSFAAFHHQMKLAEGWF